MKQAVAIFTFLIFVASSVAAQPLRSGGINPDSFLYGLDVALDKIRLAIASGEREKALVGLDIASERLAELRETIEQGKLEAGERARLEHTQILAAVEGSLSLLESTNETDVVDDLSEIEVELEKQETEVEEVSDQLRVRIEIRGGLTEEQKARIDSILSSLSNRTGEVKIKIDNRKSELKLRIKDRLGNETVADEIIERIEEKHRLHEIREAKAAEQIEEAKEEINEAIELLSRINETDLNTEMVRNFLNNTQTHLANAEEAFAAGEFGRAFGQATAAENMAKALKKHLENLLEKEEDEEEIEIEVEVENGVSKVKVKTETVRHKFILETADRDQIIAEIAARTGLTVEEISAIAEFELEEETESDEKEEISSRLEVLKEQKEAKEIVKEARKIVESQKEKIRSATSNSGKTDTKSSENSDKDSDDSSDGSSNSDSDDD